MTYRQLTLLVKAALRKARRAERALDTSLEKAERELDRLILRKTLVEPKSLASLNRLWQDVNRKMPACDAAIRDAFGAASPA